MCAHPDSPRVLVVDDDPSARETARMHLHADLYALELATSGRDVLDRLGGPPVDLVICDVLMPSVDGLEICRRIKADPAWRFTPVILATALDGEDDLVRGLEAGADDFLVKPLRRLVLRARTRALLRVRGLYRQLIGARVPDVDTLLRLRRERIVDAAGLTIRERDVLELLLLGRSHEEIGYVLGISARTSKHHQRGLLAKLGAESRHDLLRLFL